MDYIIWLAKFEKIMIPSPNGKRCESIKIVILKYMLKVFFERVAALAKCSFTSVYAHGTSKLYSVAFYPTNLRIGNRRKAEKHFLNTSRHCWGLTHIIRLRCESYTHWAICQLSSNEISLWIMMMPAVIRIKQLNEIQNFQNLKIKATIKTRNLTFWPPLSPSLAWTCL